MVAHPQNLCKMHGRVVVGHPQPLHRGHCALDGRAVVRGHQHGGGLAGADPLQQHADRVVVRRVRLRLATPQRAAAAATTVAATAALAVEVRPADHLGGEGVAVGLGQRHVVVQHRPRPAQVALVRVVHDGGLVGYVVLWREPPVQHLDRRLAVGLFGVEEHGDAGGPRSVAQFFEPHRALLQRRPIGRRQHLRQVCVRERRRPLLLLLLLLLQLLLLLDCHGDTFQQRRVDEGRALDGGEPHVPRVAASDHVAFLAEVDVERPFLLAFLARAVNQRRDPVNLVQLLRDAKAFVQRFPRTKHAERGLPHHTSGHATHPRGVGLKQAFHHVDQRGVRAQLEQARVDQKFLRRPCPKDFTGTKRRQPVQRHVPLLREPPPGRCPCPARYSRRRQRWGEEGAAAQQAFDHRLDWWWFVGMTVGTKVGSRWNAVCCAVAAAAGPELTSAT